MSASSLAGDEGKPLCGCMGSITADEFCPALDGAPDCTFGDVRNRNRNIMGRRGAVGTVDSKRKTLATR